MSDEGFLLSPDNVAAYLAGQGLASTADRVTARELGGGVSNIVLLIERPDQSDRWVVKQSLGKLRVKDDWRSDRRRVFREAEAIQSLRASLGDSVPEVVHVDRDNFLFIMTGAPAGSVVWKDLLLVGHVNPTVAREAGRLLARMIAAPPELRARFGDRSVFDQLRIDPYYRTTAVRHPDVSRELHELIAESWQIRTGLVHGDYSPKNMLVCGDHIFLIDFEVVHWGDPAFDSGFLLNHLLLKALHQPRFGELYLEAARQFWDALCAGLGPAGDTEFERMTVRHLGALMLARIDGKSPVEYIREETTRERVRRVAKRILLERSERLTDAIGLVRAETAAGRASVVGTPTK